MPPHPHQPTAVPKRGRCSRCPSLCPACAVCSSSSLQSNCQRAACLPPQPMPPTPLFLALESAHPASPSVPCHKTQPPPTQTAQAHLQPPVSPRPASPPLPPVLFAAMSSQPSFLFLSLLHSALPPPSTPISSPASAGRQPVPRLPPCRPPRAAASSFCTIHSCCKSTPFPFPCQTNREKSGGHPHGESATSFFLFQLVAYLIACPATLNFWPAL